MAITTVNTPNEVIQFQAKYYAEYVRANQFGRYIGTNTNAIIQLKEDLTTKAGKTISVPLITRLQGNGVTGNGQLEGNEEQLGNYAKEVEIAARRNGVADTDWEEQKTAIDMMKAAREQLLNWNLNMTRDGIILDGLHSINASTAHNVKGTRYAAAAAADLNTWQTNNSDRILYGNALSNIAANDHAASLLNITAAMTLNRGTATVAKRMAKLADPHIRPAMVKMPDGAIEEWFVCFVPSYAFRDLRADMDAVHQTSMQRGKNNPLYRDGDLVYEGIIFREIEEIPGLGAVGQAGAEVQPVFMCGAQAVAKCVGRRPKFDTDTRDYNFVHGVAISEFVGYDKLTYNGKDHGMVTMYVAAAPDA